MNLLPVSLLGPHNAEVGSGRVGDVSKYHQFGLPNSTRQVPTLRTLY